jgi:phospholipid transport system transporter-binding protein
MLALPAQLTLHEAHAALAALAPAIKACADPVVALDAAALTNIDSSTLAVLLACKRAAQARQRGFAVHNAPTRLIELAHLYGVEKLLALEAH